MPAAVPTSTICTQPLLDKGCKSFFCPAGSGNVGDGNWGNGAIGHDNHASNFYGYYDLP